MPQTNQDFSVISGPMLMGPIAFEHYRIHVIELWPDGPRKEAGLASARSVLDRMGRTMPGGSSFACAICARRRQTVNIRESAGGAGRALGRRADGSEDEKLPVAEADPGGAVRVCGVDAGQALEAFAVCGTDRENNER
jgi:hypothetical protein